MLLLFFFFYHCTPSAKLSHLPAFPKIPKFFLSSLGSHRSSHKTSDKSSTPGDPVAGSSRPTSARSRSSRRSSHNSLTAESDNDNKEQEQGNEGEDKESNRNAKRTSSSSSSLSSSSDSDDEKDNVRTEGLDPVVSEDEPPALKFHVSNGNEACLLTKGSHGLLICKFAQCMEPQQCHFVMQEKSSFAIEFERGIFQTLLLVLGENTYPGLHKS